jgi:hypothetical protein
MNDQTTPTWKIFMDWTAAALGIGTFAGLVNVAVGVLSGMWVAVQLITWYRYDRHVKRARYEAAMRGQLQQTQPGDL